MSVCPWCEGEGANKPEDTEYILVVEMGAKALRQGFKDEYRGRWHEECWADAASHGKRFSKEPK